MIDQREEGKNHFGLSLVSWLFVRWCRCVAFIHELDGASFSDRVEGVHACFLGGNVGQSAAAGGGNAGYLKLTPTLLRYNFSSPFLLLLCSHCFGLTLPQPAKPT